MTLVEQISEEAKTLPEARQREQKAIEQEMDEIIQENMEALQSLAECPRPHPR